MPKYVIDQAIKHICFRPKFMAEIVGLWVCSKRTRTILCKYDCDCVPFFENRLGVVWACNDLADLFGLPHSPESPPATPGCFSTPTSDPNVTVSVDSRKLTVSVFPRYREKLAWNFGSLPTASQLMHNLSANESRTLFRSGSTTPTTIFENMHNNRK